MVSLGSVLFVLGCEEASGGSAGDEVADVVSTPEVPADTEAPLDVASAVPDSEPDAEDAADDAAPDDLDETADVAADEDVIAIDPCDVPGVPPEAVRCYEPPLSGLVAVGDALVSFRFMDSTHAEAVLLNSAGVLLHSVPSGLDGVGPGRRCGPNVCVVSGELTETELRLFSREFSIEDGQLVAKTASTPLVLPRASGVRLVTHGEVPIVLVKTQSTPWQRCVLGVQPTCEEFPVPVECLDGEIRLLMDAVDGPTSTIIAGQCEYPNVAASGIGRPFIFEWERGNGVTWTTEPEAWVGLSFPQLYPDATGYSVVALQLPQGGSDDTGAPIGLSLTHVGSDGIPGDVWNSPLTYGFNFSAAAAVRGGDLLVAWTGANGESPSDVRLTFAGAQDIPTTTTIAPVGYGPGGVVAFGDGYVLNLSGRLVRLDAAGAPVAWPSAP